MIVIVTNPPTSELPALRKVVRSSTVDLIADQLRNAVYNGSLAPGQSINEVRTAELLGVSRPSLREALQRLISEGVMTHAPGRGVHVRRMRSSDIDDVYAVREAIESQAIKLIIRRGRSTTGVARALRDLERAIEDNVARTIGDADLSFHHALVAGSGSSRLTELMKVAMVHTRLLSLSERRGYEVRCDVLDSHLELAEAVAEGDESRSLTALAQIMSEAASRLHGPDEGLEAQVIKGDGLASAVDDQWSQLRESTQ
jgi:DNA-binding GntR family transcriptional regulator